MSESQDAAEVMRAALDPLTVCAVDTERYVARAGWDQPPRLFAIASNAGLLAREPALAPQLAGADPSAYSTIEQDTLAPSADIESLLRRMTWPQEVEGVALVVERLVVPPEAETGLPDDPAKAAAALAAHPDRRDVRLTAAVLRDGQSVCLLRQRDHDSDDKVAIGRDIAPGLVAALQATLR